MCVCVFKVIFDFAVAIYCAFPVIQDFAITVIVICDATVCSFTCVRFKIVFSLDVCFNRCPFGCKKTECSIKP